MKLSDVWKMSVKTAASWSQHFFKTRLETPSGLTESPLHIIPGEPQVGVLQCCGRSRRPNCLGKLKVGEKHVHLMWEWSCGSCGRVCPGFVVCQRLYSLPHPTNICCAIELRVQFVDVLAHCMFNGSPEIVPALFVCLHISRVKCTAVFALIMYCTSPKMLWKCFCCLTFF